jgi:hypothetical protein
LALTDEGNKVESVDKDFVKVKAKEKNNEDHIGDEEQLNEGLNEVSNTTD